MNFDDFTPEELMALDSGDISKAVEIMSAKHGVDSKLVHAVMQSESEGKQGAVSPKGAIGLMQLMPDTAKSLGVDPHDPMQNLWGGTKYLKDQLDTFKDPRLAVAAYNAGPEAVTQHRGVPPFHETQSYVRKVMNLFSPSEAQAAERPDYDKMTPEQLVALEKQQPIAEKKNYDTMSPEELMALDKGQVEPKTKQPTREELRAGMLEYPGKVIGGIQDILNWPHSHIVEPLVQSPLRRLLERLPSMKEHPIVPKLLTDPTMLMHGAEPVFSEERQVMPSSAELFSGLTGQIADIPVYAGALKAAGTMGEVLKGLLPVGKITAPPSAIPIAPAGEVLRTGPGVSPLAQKLAEEAQIREGGIAAYEAKSYPSTTIMGTEEKIIGKGKARKTIEIAKPTEAFPIEEKLTPARTQQIVRAQQRANQEIINAAEPTIAAEQEADATLRKNKAIVNAMNDSVKFMRSGGPTSEEMQNFIREHLGTGGTLGSAVRAIGDKFKISPEGAMDAVRRVTQVSMGSVSDAAGQKIRATAAAVDSSNAPLANAVAASDFKSSLPSLRDVGTDVPKPPDMPYKIVPEDTTPKGNVNTLKAQFLSPSLVARRLFAGDGPIMDWFKSWHRTLFEQAYYRRFLNNLFQSAGLMDDVTASEKAAKGIFGPLARDMEQKTYTYNKAVADLEAQLKKNPNDLVAKDALDKTNRKYGVDINAANTLLEQHASDLEKQYANIRIKRAADGNKDSWNLLNKEEQVVATKLQEFYKQFKGRLDTQGVPTISGIYTNHVYHWAGYGTDQGMMAFVNKLWWQKYTPPEMLKFLNRTGNADWFPLAYQSADIYTGAAVRKLAFNDWYGKWTPAMDTWDKTGFHGTSEWLRGFLQRNMTSPKADMMDRAVNALVNFEYAHYLMGNFSPALLHLFKVTQTPAYWGFGPTGKAIGQYAGAVASKAGAGASENLRAIEFYNMTPQIIQALEQSPAWAGTFQPTFWQKLRGNPILNPTRLTEHFDRGVQTLAAINSGVDAHATANTINNGIMDALIRMNFYSWDAPAFIQQHRGLTMFQMQPWKLVETKGLFLQDAITGTRDVYGGSPWPKLARLAVMVGGIIGAGQLAGLDLTKHAGAHVPFITDTISGGHGPAIAPVIGDIETIQKVFNEGWTAGLKDYLSYGGVVQKALQERIPLRYEGGPAPRAQWLLGIPTAGWRGRAEERSEAIQDRQRKRMLRAMALHSGDVTPYQFLLNALGD
jgi:hypothetical protein